MHFTGYQFLYSLIISCIFSNFIRKKGLFEEYRNHPDKAVRERANNWSAAVGLQNVDGLSVSEFLIQIARQQIEGKITMEEITHRLNEHYEHNKSHSSTYEIVPPGSEMHQQIKEGNKLRRPKMYEEDYRNSIYLWQNSDRQEFYKPRGCDNQLGLELRISEQCNHYCSSWLGKEFACKQGCEVGDVAGQQVAYLSDRLIQCA